MDEIKNKLDEEIQCEDADQNLAKGTDSLGNQKCSECCATSEIMKRQVAMLAKERDSLHVLWQTSQKAVEALEVELKTYQKCHQSHTHQPSTKEDLRPLELRLETSLNDYLDLEQKFKALSSTNQYLQNELNNKDKEINNSIEKEKILESKLEEIKKELDEAKINLEAEKKNNEELKYQVTRYEKETITLSQKLAEAKAKVAEALQLFDLVSAQKNEANKKLNDVRDELEDTKSRLENAKKEALESFQKDLEKIKEKYNQKVADMLQHVRTLDAELVEKGTLFANLMRDNKVLQKTVNELTEQNKNNENALDPKLALAEERLKTLFDQMLKTETRKMCLESQRQALAMELQRCKDSHVREIKRRDWEEKMLRTRCDEQSLQIEHLQKSLDETHNMISKLQVLLNSKSDLSHRVLMTKEEELAELNKHLENQMKLNKKWKKTYIEMTNKLKDKLQIVKEENEKLKKEICKFSDKNADLNVSEYPASDNSP